MRAERKAGEILAQMCLICFDGIQFTALTRCPVLVDHFTENQLELVRSDVRREIDCYLMK